MEKNNIINYKNTGKNLGYSKIYNGQIDFDEDNKTIMLHENDYSGLSNAINDICMDINTVLKNSEHEFLAIGGQLGKYSISSREIVKMSSLAASVYTSQELVNGIKELECLIERFSEHCSLSADEIKNDREELLQILEQVEITVNMLSDFKIIVKHSRMLCSSIRIESSRLEADERGFDTLSENVDELSELISTKSVLLFNKAVFLLKEISKTASELNKDNDEQRKQSEMILNRAGISLNVFKEKYYESHKKTEIISEKYGKVSKEIYEIVTLIQIHDVTRQQMESVRDELNEITIKIGKHHYDKDPHHINELLILTHDTCKYNIHQLENIFGEFESAVLCIISKLKSVGEHIASILNESFEISANGELSKMNSFHEVRKDLSAISVGLNMNITLQTKLSGAVASVASIIDDLTASIAAIEGFGTEMELVALNAIIKAAHAGSKHSALGIIAESIKKLSIETKEQTGRTAGVLKNIGMKSNDIKAKTQSASNEKSMSFMETNEKINKIVDSLTEMRNESGGLIERIKMDVLELEKGINSMASGIQVHKKTGLIVNQALSSLNAIVSSLKVNIRRNGGEISSEVNHGYMIEDERNQRNNSITNNSTQFDNIELF